MSNQQVCTTVLFNVFGASQCCKMWSCKTLLYSPTTSLNPTRLNCPQKQRSVHRLEFILQEMLSISSMPIWFGPFCAGSFMSCLQAGLSKGWLGQAVDFVNERLDQGMSVGVICEEMLDHCLAKNPKEARGIGCDNMTAQVVVFRKSAAPAAPEASAKG